MKKQRLRLLLPILLLLAALILPASGLAEEPPRDVKDLINPPPTASVFQNGEPITEGGDLTTEPVFVEFEFRVPVLGDGLGPDLVVKKGDYFKFELSSGFAWESDEYYPLMDGSTIIGHITITTEDDGKVYANVVFDGDDEVFNGTLSSVKCKFWGEFTYNGDGGEAGAGKDTVQILEKDYTIIIPPGEIIYTLNKSGDVDMKTGLVTWTVVVGGVQDNQPIDLSGYTFEDVLSDAGDFYVGSFKVNDVTPTGTDADYDPITKKLTYEFPDGTGDGPKTITYQTQIPQDKYYSGAEETLKNSALLKDKDGDTVKKDAATVTFTPGWISKSGEAEGEWAENGNYTPIDRTITWTIDITNPDPNTPMKGVKVTDTLPAGLTFASATVAYKTGPNESDWGTSTSIAPIGDVYTLNDDVSHAARLVIVATVPDDTYTVGVTTYTNSASVSWDGLPVGIDGIGTGGVGVGIGFVPISKSGRADTETGQVTWTVNVDTRGQNIQNLKVYDLLVYGADTSSLPATLPGGTQLSDLTPQFNQRFNGWGSRSAGLINAVIPVMDGETQVADLLEVTGLSNDTVNTFTFTSQILDPNILAGNARKDVLNTATLYSGNTYLNQATATVSYFGRVLQKSMLHREAAKAPLIGTNANDVASQLSEGFNYEDKTVVFRLNVNVNGIDLTGLEGNPSGEVTVTDTLPEGWEFVPMVEDGPNYYLLAGTSVNNGGEIQVAENPTHLTLPSENFSAAVAGGSATFTFNPLEDRYVILLRARPTDARAAVLFNDNKTTTETNNVSMETKNWTGYKVEDTQSVTVDSKLVGKSAAVNKDAGFATWTLDYRPYDIKASFPDDTADVYLTDTIPEGVELRTDAAGNLLFSGNIKVYPLTLTADGTYTVGTEIDDLDPFAISYDNASRQLRFNIPANNIAQGYRFTYITDITGNPGKKVTNAVMLIGKSEEGTPTSASFNISTSGASGEVGRRGGNLRIKKYNALTRPFADVPFTLYGSNDGGSSFTVPIRSAVTDAQGELTLRYIPGPDTIGQTVVYKLREELPTPLDTYYEPLVYQVEVKRESENKYITTVTKSVGGEEIPQVEGVLPLRNLTKENNRTNISANKIWVGGYIADRNTPAILVLKAYIDGVEVAEIDNAVLLPEIVSDLMNRDKYTYIWKDLPKNDINGKEITYKVEEPNAPNNYEASIINGPDEDDSDTYTRDVTNTYVFKATKTWINGRYAVKPDVWLKLYRHIEGEEPEAVPSDEPGGTPQQPTGTLSWSGSPLTARQQATWYGLDMQDDDGNPYIYTVVEGVYDEDTDTFTPSPNAAEAGFPWNNAYDDTKPAVTNEYEIPLVDVSASKVWVGDEHERPAVTFKLQRQFIPGPGVTGANPWIDVAGSNKTLPSGVLSLTWDDMEATDSQGRKYKYRVWETNHPDDYKFSYLDATNTVTNTHFIRAEKTWVNGRYVDPKPEVYFMLYRQIGPNGTPVPVPGTQAGFNPRKLGNPTYASDVFTAKVTVDWDGVDKYYIDPDTDEAIPYIYSVVEGQMVGGVFTPSAPLNFEATPDANGLDITNEYVIPKDAAVSATKVWNDPATAQAQRPSVGFQLYRQAKDPEVPGSMYGTEEAVGDPEALPTTGDLKVDWTDLERTDDQGREYVFTVKEGVFDGDGKFSEGLPDHYNVATEENEAGIVVTNTYTATGSLTLSGVKTFSGRAATEEDVFEFKLYKDSVDEANLLQTKTVTGSGNIAFDAIIYNLDLQADPVLNDLGDHTYVVVETVPDPNPKNGITYDETQYTVTVTVTDNGDGTLDVQPTENHDALDFTNTYAATGSLTLSGVKTFAGRDATEEDVFEFKLYKDSVDEANLLQTKTVTGSGALTFDAITYHLNLQTTPVLNDLGNHTYIVVETRPGTNPSDGITYDTTQYTVTVTVADKGDGTLNAVVTSNNADALNFANTYAATGSLTLSGVKTFAGRDATEEDVFEFKLYKDSVDEANLLQTKQVTGSGNIAFDAIIYNLDLQADPVLNDLGDHTYVVVETVPDPNPKNGITYDETQYTVTVTVTDNGDGTLDVQPTENHDALDFTNTYEAMGGLTFSGSKTLTGRDMTAGEFTFEVYEGDAETGTLVGTANNIAATAGEAVPFTFPAFSYTLADVGTKTYTVVENTSALPSGVSQTGTTIYTVWVTISDNGDGSLYLLPSQNFNALNFTNLYTEADVTFSKVAAGQTEELEGAELKVKGISIDFEETWESDGTAKVLTLVPGEYTMIEDQAPLGYDVAETITFRVNLNGSVEIKEGEEWVSAADAKIQMVDELTKRDVTFSKVAAGQTEELEGATLTVKVKDKDGNMVEVESWKSTGTAKVLKLPMGEYTMIEDQAPLGYDVAETITFRVNPGGSVQIKEGEEWVNAAAAKIQMVDKPTPRPTDPPTPIYPTLKVPLKAQKVLKNGSLKAGEFTFQLKDKNGNVIAEAKNAADGTVTFPDRTFSKEVSNYIYTIQEVAGTNSKVTYDKTVYTVKVSTKAVDGKLEATVNVEKDGVPYAGSMTFTNRVAMPQTGDSQPQLMFILALSGLVALMVGILLRKKRES